MSGKRVLVAEDDRFLRRACETSLRARGFTVATAADGEEALRAVRADRPDLIVIDMLMPKLSGLDVRSRSAQDVEALTRLGANGCLVKARLSLQQLGDHVTEILAR